MKRFFKALLFAIVAPWAALTIKEYKPMKRIGIWLLLGTIGWPWSIYKYVKDGNSL